MTLRRRLKAPFPKGQSQVVAFSLVVTVTHLLLPRGVAAVEVDARAVAVAVVAEGYDRVAA
jgi:hypothetical protein